MIAALTLLTNFNAILKKLQYFSFHELPLKLLVLLNLLLHLQGKCCPFFLRFFKIEQTYITCLKKCLPCCFFMHLSRSYWDSKYNMALLPYMWACEVTNLLHYGLGWSLMPMLDPIFFQV